MPDARLHRKIAQRCDLEFPQQSHPLRRWRRRLTLAAMLAALLVVAWPIVAGRPAFFQSRPVSLAHGLYRNDCRCCHQQPWQPLLRLVTWNETAHGVADVSCRQCHRAFDRLDHAPKLVADEAQACRTCHREHRPDGALLQVADAHCTHCHADLHTADGPSQTFAARIAHFDEHPPFALHRMADNPPGAGHGVHQRLVSDPQHGGAWRDATRLRFNHARHLSENLPTPPGYQHRADHGTTTLACADCHQPRGDGRHFQPISYQRHCAGCHPLLFSRRLAKGGPLPHAEAAVVRGVMRDRLMEYIQAHPEELHPDGGTRRLPNQAPPPAMNAKDQWEWVERLLREEDEAVFRGVRHGCAHCHHLHAAEAADGWLGLRTVPTAIPDRWMPHARFDHRRHATLECAACHAAGQSTTAADVLMPSITVCRDCHRSSAASTGSTQVRADCVTCHDYHRHAHLESWREGSLPGTRSTD